MNQVQSTYHLWYMIYRVSEVWINVPVRNKLSTINLFINKFYSSVNGNEDSYRFVRFIHSVYLRLNNRHYISTSWCSSLWFRFAADNLIHQSRFNGNRFESVKLKMFIPNFSPPNWLYKRGTVSDTNHFNFVRLQKFEENETNSFFIAFVERVDRGWGYRF